MSTTAPAAPSAAGVRADDSVEELRARTRAFAEEWLIPYEELAEANHGKVPDEVRDGIIAGALKAGLAGGRHKREHGGQGWSTVEWLAVEEELGRTTNGLWWWIPDAYNVLGAGTPEQIERYLAPCLRGEMIVSYAVTEELAGSDPSEIRARASRTDGGWLVSGEKWFVTSGDVAGAHVVVANAIDGDRRLPTLFIVDADSPGIEVIDEPAFTHNYPHGHPTFRFTDVHVPDDHVLGEVGAAEELQRAWFVEERLAIAARCVGRVGAQSDPGWSADLRLPGGVVPARRFGRRCRCRTPAQPRGRQARRRWGGPEAHPRQSLDGQALRERGGLALRRPGGPGLRRPRVPSQQRRGAAAAGASRRPHLGGDQRDPAPDHRPIPGASRRDRHHPLTPTGSSELPWIERLIRLDSSLKHHRNSRNVEVAVGYANGQREQRFVVRTLCIDAVVREQG
jgi:hypothetical protein